MSAILNPFHLLELHIISAQDLAHVSRSMQTYAVTWIHPGRKLSSRVDSHGKTDPSWNDSFVFKVDEGFLQSDTSAVTIEIYSVHWIKDILVGTVRVIVGNLLPPRSSRPFRGQRNVGMQFAALQVRRPSGRPQGILNVGVALLDSSRKSMPLYSDISTSLTISTDNITDQPQSIVNVTNNEEPSHELSGATPVTGDGATAIIEPMLRRSKSESSSMEVAADGSKLKRKVSFRERLNSIISASEGSSSQDQKLLKGSSSIPTSLVNGYYVSHPNENANPDKAGKSGKDSVAEGSLDGRSGVVNVTELNEGMMLVDLRDPPKGMKRSNSRKMITKSGLGPSASKVLVAPPSKGRVPYRVVAQVPNRPWAVEGSVVTMSESMEGLQSKLERWRKELPVIYDMSEITSFSPSLIRSGARGNGHGRTHADGGSQGGLFSCFSSICGCECSIVCGSGSGSGRDSSPPKSWSRQRCRSHSPNSATVL